MTERLRRLWVALRHFQSPARDPLAAGALAAFIGLVVGYAALGFRQAIAFVQTLAFGSGAEDIIAVVAALDWWHVIAAPVLGGVVVAALLRWTMKGGTALGVAEVIEANAVRAGQVPLGSGLASAAVAITALGSGASVGREGPVVHLGATLASAVTRLLRAPPAFARLLLACGVAAAVAASFNAPIAGVFFAQEVVLGSYALSAFAPIVVASVIATIVTRIHIGDSPAFTIPDYHLASFWEMPAFLLLGLIAALVAIAFIRLTALFDDAFARLPVPRWALPPAAGLIVGLAALGLPELIGVGYGATNAALQQSYGLELLLALLAAKLLLTPLCVAARFGGGVFSPSLFLGAMTGGGFGLIAAMAVPGLETSHGFYAIVGMGAVSGAVLGAPISTFLIVFELTGGYQLTLALMIATSVASLITSRFYHAGFFAWQLSRRGVNPYEGRTRLALRQHRVADVMQEDYLSVAADAPLSRLRSLFEGTPADVIAVLGSDGQFLGLIEFRRLGRDLYDPRLDSLVVAGDLALPTAHWLRPDDHLATALARMQGHGGNWLPVINAGEEPRLRALLSRRDLMAAVNRVLLDAEDEREGKK